ncbi:MAG: hypothetical protein M3Z08_24305 [Chloroflexota bacterium]|nr:hypothetical protein [Chloroflexota bacterium]
MYDNLLEEDPHIQEIAARIAEKRVQRVAQGMAQEMAQGMAQNKFRETILGLVQDRFPALQAVVAQKIAAIDDTDALQKIILALALAPDETVARHYVTALEAVHAPEA